MSDPGSIRDRVGMDEHAAAEPEHRRDRNVVRAVAALGLFGLAEHAVWVTVLVIAYERGGAVEAGIVAAAMLVPAAIVAPVVAHELTSPQHVNPLAIGYAVQLLSLVTLTLVLTLHVHSLIVYLAAALATVAITFTRPAHHAVIARSRQMVGATVATGAVSGASQLLGPLIASVVLMRFEPSMVVGVSAVLVAGSTLIAMGISRPVAPERLPLTATPTSSMVGAVRGLGRPATSTVVVLFALLGLVTVVLGTTETLATEVSYAVLGLEGSGIGVLLAAMGGGLLLGAWLAGVLARRHREHQAMRLGAVLCGLGLAATALPIGLVTAIAAFTLVGVGMQTVLVAGWVLLHRVVCKERTSLVFGFLESQQLIGNGLGAIGAGVAIGALGITPVVAAVGVTLPIAMLAMSGERAARLVRPPTMMPIRPDMPAAA
jgi:hypothetical protein